jgi:hypothetical protein
MDARCFAGDESSLKLSFSLKLTILRLQASLLQLFVRPSGRECEWDPRGSGPCQWI